MDLLLLLLTVLPLLGVMLMRAIPCQDNCLCEADCISLHDDDYTTNKISTHYSVRAGTWVVTGGQIVTASTPALIVTTAIVPVGITAAFCSVDLMLLNTTDKAFILLAYQNDNNYWFAELKAGTTTVPGELKLFERTGGTNTQRGSTGSLANFLASDTVRLSICSDNGYFIAKAVDVTGTGGTAFAHFYTASGPTLAGTKFGLGTTAGNISNAFFDNLNCSYSPTGRCTHCTSCIDNCDVMPVEGSLTFTGITNGSGGQCPEVSLLNATHQILLLLTSPASGCTLAKSITGICAAHACPGAVISATFSKVGSDTQVNVHILVGGNPIGGGVCIGHTEDHGFVVTAGPAPQPCKGLGELELTGGMAGAMLDTSGATCTLEI